MRKVFLTEYAGADELTLVVDAARHCAFTRAWAGALHAGFALRIPKTMYVSELLTAYAGLERAYVDDRIRAVFVDGHPVDDIDTASVSALQELSLSAAMPGVAGIVMGRANAFAVYRRDITFQADEGGDHGPGLVLVRLFNFIAAEAGANFLALGAGLDSRTWQRFTADLPAGFWAPVLRAELDGAPLDAGALASLPAHAQGGLRFVRIVAEGAEA